MSEEEVRRFAYAKWEAEGRPEGQQERHWREAEMELRSGGEARPHSEAIEEASNNWPAAEDGAGSAPVSPPVKDFNPPESDGRRTFQNGDTDRDRDT